MDSFACPVCGKTLPDQRALHRHKATQHKTFVCPICGHDMQGRTLFTLHMKGHQLTCSTCHKSFTTTSNLKRHTKRVHQKNHETPLPCPVCQVVIEGKKKLDQHVKTHSSCPICSKEFMTKAKLKRHQQIHKTLYQCPICHVTITGWDAYRAHKKTHKRTSPQKTQAHLPSTSSVSSDPPVQIDPRSPMDLGHLDTEVSQVYRQNWGAIRSHYTEGRVQTFFNYRWPSDDAIPDWDNDLINLFERQGSVFKINYSHSFILVHRETGEYRFFHASQNNHRCLDQPRLIRNRQEFQNFLDTLNNGDALEYAKRARPNTKWQVHSIASTSFYLNKLFKHPIGCVDKPLPNYIVKNKWINPVWSSPITRHMYTDNFCIFRCLALHQKATDQNLDEKTRALFQTWIRTQNLSGDSFPGLENKDLDLFETCFQVNVQVYAFEKTKQKKKTTSHPSLTPSLTLERRSPMTYKSTLYVINHDNHFCYIRDIKRVTKDFVCSQCQRVFDRHDRLLAHEIKCDGTIIRSRYPGGTYKVPPTPLEILSRNGLDLDVHYFFKYRATYDFEAFMQKVTDHPLYVAKHIPLSVSVCSNVPDFEEPRCFVSRGNPQDLIDDMIDYLETISNNAFRLQREEFQAVFEQIDERQREEEEDQNGEHVYPLKATELRRILDAYLQELPVIGFNSGKYDLNLIKSFLIKKLRTMTLEESDDDDEHGDDGDEGKSNKKSKNNPFKYVIKSSNTFKCLATRKFKFLDMSFYLAAGMSYDQYLKTFEADQAKGFFPYEYIDSIDKLNERQLPPKSAFFSTLKNEGISDENYAHCQSVWRDNNMETLKDYLIHYNNLDVLPFLQAIENQSKFYKSKNIDLFKSGVSLPALTLKLMFQDIPEDVHFNIVSEKHKDLHELMKNEIVGGPSLIFHRYAEKDKTTIRGGDKGVCSVQGFDANSLYLGCIMKDCLTGDPIRRQKTHGFKPERVQKYGKGAREWLSYISHSQGVWLRTAYNQGEQQLGKKKIPVDGFDPLTQTVYQYDGCLVHGCECVNYDISPINNKPMAEVREHHNDVHQYLTQTLGLNVIRMKECEWTRLKQEDASVKQFMQVKFQPYISPFKPKQEITMESILQAVKDDHLFGLIQCDLEVPERLREKFGELQPIFKNTLVSRDDIGPFMRTFAEENKLLSRPVRTLVGSFWGKGVLLITPLLKFYLRHGVEVTDIQQVVEYTPIACFRSFGETVCAARRAADQDPDKALLAEIFKTHANSSYGKTITDVSKHRNIKFVTDDESQRLLRDPLFRKLTVLDDDLNEIEMQKQTVLYNLPITIGFTVYNHAKLRLLEFYYDCLDKYIDRENFQLLFCDTDSLYFSLATDTLDQAIKPHLKRQFYEDYHNWFPSRACDQHRPDFVQAMCEGKGWESPSDCCVQRQQFDKRTVELFKQEYVGTAAVALCSKTYFCEGEKNKPTCKGLQKRHNPLSKDKYMSVLKHQKASGGWNKGFRTDGKGVFTYNQYRHSLSFLYIKRQVQQDGVTTLPTLV